MTLQQQDRKVIQKINTVPNCNDVAVNKATKNTGNTKILKMLLYKAYSNKCRCLYPLRGKEKN